MYQHKFLLYALSDFAPFYEEDQKLDLSICFVLFCGVLRVPITRPHTVDNKLLHIATSGRCIKVLTVEC